MELAGELARIERSLWTNDASLYASTYLPEAVLIFPGVGELGRDAAVAAIRAENESGHHWAAVDFDEFRVTHVAGGAELVTYKATARWNYEAQAATMLCATLYVRRDGRWRVIFHQQTMG